MSESKIEKQVNLHIEHMHGNVNLRNEESLEIFQIDSNYINTKKALPLTNSDVYYYKITNSIDIIGNAVCNDIDIPNFEAIDAAKNIIIENEDCKVLFITGNGGTGKTTLMFRLAIYFSVTTCPAFWLTINEKTIAKSSVIDLICKLKRISKEKDSEAFLFIDNPFANMETLKYIHDAVALDNHIKLVICERLNRLGLAFGNIENEFYYWNESAYFLCVAPKNTLKSFDWIDKKRSVVVSPTVSWKKDVVLRMINVLSKKYSVDVDIFNAIVERNTLLENDNVSVVEVMYSILNDYNHMIPERGIPLTKIIKLDWNEWEDIVKKHFNSNSKYSFAYLAALYLFKIPTNTYLLSKILNLPELSIKPILSTLFTGETTEPIVYQNSKVYLKHDIIADMFFKFNNISVHEIVTSLLPLLDDETMCQFEKNALNKGYATGKQAPPFDFDIEKTIDFIRKSSSLIDVLERNERLYSFRLAEAWNLKKAKKHGEYYSFLQNLTSTFPDNERIKLEYAIMLSEKGDHVAAEECLLSMINRSEPNLYALNYYSKLLVSTKRFTEAILQLEKSLALNPDDLIVLSRLGMTYTLIDQPDMAIEILIHQKKLGFDNLLLLFQIGRRLSAIGKMEQAIKVYDLFLQNDPNNISIISKLGQLYAVNKKTDEAEKQFLHALTIRPDYIPILNRLGKLYLYADRYDESENVFNRIIELDNRFVKPYLNLAIINIEHGNIAEAEIYFKRALAFSKDNIIILDALLQFYENQGFNDKAKILYDEYRSILQARTRQTIKGGRNLIKKKEYKAAEKLLLRVFKHDSDNTAIINELGRLYRIKKNYAKAEEFLLKGLQIEQNNIHLLNELGKTYSVSGRLDEALLMYNKALSVDSCHVYSMTELARLYLLKKDYEEAEQQLENAIRLDSENVIVLNNLAKLYIEKKDYQSAERAYLSALKIKKNDSYTVTQLFNLYYKNGRLRDAEKLLNDSQEALNNSRFTPNSKNPTVKAE